LDPDEGLRIAVEKELGCEPADTKQTATVLRGLDPVLLLAVPDGEVRLPLEEEDCRILTARLLLGWTPHLALVKGASEGLDEEGRRLLLVRCRTLRMGEESVPEAQARFLGDLARLAGSNPDFFAMLGRVAPLLSGLLNDEAIYAGLQMHKLTLARALREKLEFERDLKSSNMETMLLQGRRIPEINTDETRAAIRDIDRACLAVFGRTEVMADQAVMEADHGSFDPDDDLDRIFNLFE
ncbi:MAG: hypothetical protein ACOCWR_07670, partial [Oceanidesulfovibrio sp.]